MYFPPSLKETSDLRKENKKKPNNMNPPPMEKTYTLPGNLNTWALSSPLN
jgi:hypothetical protein